MALLKPKGFDPYQYLTIRLAVLAPQAALFKLGFTKDEINDELTKNSAAKRESQEVAERPGEEGRSDRAGNRKEDAEAYQRQGQEEFVLAGQTNEQAVDPYQIDSIDAGYRLRQTHITPCVSGCRPFFGKVCASNLFRGAYYI